MLANWTKRILVFAVVALLMTACGGNNNSPKNATEGTVTSEEKVEQPAQGNSESKLNIVEYKGSKTVMIDENVIAMIIDEKLSAEMDGLEEEKYDALSDYYEKVIDYLNEHYIEKTEHAKDVWNVYLHVDEAQSEIIVIDLGLAEDSKQAQIATVNVVSGSFEALATAKLDKNGDLTLTDNINHKDTKLGNIGHRPE